MFKVQQVGKLDDMPHSVEIKAKLCIAKDNNAILLFLSFHLLMYGAHMSISSPSPCIEGRRRALQPGGQGMVMGLQWMSLGDN
jgi:hypothetical protein